MLYGSLVLFVLAIFSASSGAVTIPKQLSVSDREEVTRTLGVATSTKLLTNPFPLGGYSGFEVGLTLELIDVSNISRLGATTGEAGDQELRYGRLAFGKGLYQNVDIFLNFVPQSAGSEMTSFGGAARWAFYEAKYLPINLSFIVSGSHANFNNDFEALSLGLDLAGGIYINNFSLYMGVGQVRTKGTFMAGTGTDATVDPSDPDVNPLTNTVSHTIHQTRSFAGFTMHFSELFLAAELDRYADTVYSARVGARF